MTGAAEQTDCFSADSHNKGPGYDTKQYNCEALAILKLWGMLLPPGPLRLGGNSIGNCLTFKLGANT